VNMIYILTPCCSCKSW